MRNALMIALGVVAAVAVASTAIGGGGTLSLTNPAAGEYAGKVSGVAGKCKRGRNVTVRHDEDEDGYDNGDFKIGSDRTNRRGRYEVTGPQAPPGDQIAAKAARKRSANCRALETTATAGP